MACPVVVGWTPSQKTYPFGLAQIAPSMTPNVRHESSVFNSEGRSPNNVVTSSRMRLIDVRVRTVTLSSDAALLLERDVAITLSVISVRLANTVRCHGFDLTI